MLDQTTHYVNFTTFWGMQQTHQLLTFDQSLTDLFWQLKNCWFFLSQSLIHSYNHKHDQAVFLHLICTAYWTCKFAWVPYYLTKISCYFRKQFFLPTSWPDEGKRLRLCAECWKCKLGNPCLFIGQASSPTSKPLLAP